TMRRDTRSSRPWMIPSVFARLLRQIAKSVCQKRLSPPKLITMHSYNLSTLMSCPHGRWEVGSEVRLGDMPAECAALLECVNASPMEEKSPNTEAFLFDTEAAFAFMGGEVQ